MTGWIEVVVAVPCVGVALGLMLEAISRAVVPELQPPTWRAWVLFVLAWPLVLATAAVGLAAVGGALVLATFLNL
jgi:hypothetical protein